MQSQSCNIYTLQGDQQHGQDSGDTQIQVSHLVHLCERFRSATPLRIDLGLILDLHAYDTSER